MARAVETTARRPQLQERITSTVADTMMEMLDPVGVFVVIEAEHMCMTMRGIRKPGAKTMTTVARGIYEDDDVKRSEILSLIKMSYAFCRYVLFYDMIRVYMNRRER